MDGGHRGKSEAIAAAEVEMPAVEEVGLERKENEAAGVEYKRGEGMDGSLEGEGAVGQTTTTQHDNVRERPWRRPS